MELIRPFKFGADYSSNSIGFNQTRCTSSPEDCHTRPVAQCRQFQEEAKDASVSECTWTLGALEALRNALYKFKTYLLTYLLIVADGRLFNVTRPPNPRGPPQNVAVRSVSDRAAVGSNSPETGPTAGRRGCSRVARVMIIYGRFA